MANLLPNILRLALLLFLQIGILQFIDVKNLNIFVYPLFIILLPFRIPNWAIIAMAFTCGIVMDGFYNSFGLHAAAATFLGFARAGILQVLEPRAGFENTTGPYPNVLSMGWFLQYLALCTATFSLVYFMLEAFSVEYILNALLKALACFLSSGLLMILITLILNPKR